MESDCDLNVPFKVDCPHMKEVETIIWHYKMYECQVCGATMKLYYDEMA